MGLSWDRASVHVATFLFAFGSWYVVLGDDVVALVALIDGAFYIHDT